MKYRSNRIYFQLLSLSSRSVTFFVMLGICLTISSTSLAINDLMFSNRAQCAADSTLPSESTFLFIDTYNARKLGNTYATTQLKQPGALSEETNSIVNSIVDAAAVEYRLAITHNSLQVMEKILSGRLPLLPTNLKANTGTLKHYQGILATCQATNQTKIQCPALNEYLRQLWSISNIADGQQRTNKYAQLDNFTDMDFIPTTSVSHLSCSLIKEFSALQAHLSVPTIDKPGIEEIGKAWLNQQKYITDCYSQDPSINNTQVVLQIETNLEKKLWNRVGFDVWNTTKIFSSWAFRNSDTIEKMSRRFHRLFRSIALEESMMLVPNGCKSLTPQMCNENTLSENSIREFARLGSKDVEHFGELPTGPEQVLISQKPPSVNADILEVRREKTASDWLQKFRKQFVLARGVSKIKVQTSLQSMQRLATTLPAEVFESGYQKLIALAKTGHAQAKETLYYSCQELRIATDQRFQFYSKELETAFSSSLLKQLNQIPDRNPTALLEYLNQVSLKVLPLCDLASQLRLTELSANLLSPLKLREWAQEAIYNERLGPNQDADLVTSVIRTTPLSLFNPSAGKVKGNTLCFDEAHCVRILVESAIRIQAAMKYAHAFNSNDGNIPTASIFNPYSELTACSIYDPWLKNRMVYQNLGKNIINTALFGWNYIPIIIDANLPIPKVTSLKKMTEEGLIRFEPGFEESKTDLTLMADLGPLFGAPCSITITGQQDAEKMTPYYFGGLSINYCGKSSEVVNTVNSAGAVSPGVQTNRNICAGCTINLISAESTASFFNHAGIAPIKFGINILRTVSNFFSDKSDTVNIPQSFLINPQYAAQVLKKFGTIPEQCVDQINRGLSCFQNLCAAQAAKAFEAATGLEVKNANVFGGNSSGASGPEFAYLETNLCSGEIRIPIHCTNEGASEDFSIDLKRLFSFQKECRDPLKKLAAKL